MQRLTNLMSPLQVWYSMGVRSVGKASLNQLLSSGKCVVAVVGGVKEVLEMNHRRDEEVLHIKDRRGIVRLALANNSPLVPVIAYGQHGTYDWARPGPESFPYPPMRLVDWVSRKVGMVPMVIWGRWYSPVPYKVPMTVVIGKPIPIPSLHDFPPMKKKLSAAAAKEGGLVMSASRELPVGWVGWCTSAMDAAAAAPAAAARRAKMMMGGRRGGTLEEDDDPRVPSYLDQYISAVVVMDDTHRGPAGYPDRKVTVM